jgi:hypothetical protein
MRNTILLLIVIAGFFTACGKKDVGYFSIPRTTAPPPDTMTQYYYFNNIIIDSNTTDTFTLPSLSQAIIDSGTVTITFRSSIVWLNNWNPLPLYTFPDGSTITVVSVAQQPGKIVLQAYGATKQAMNYCFYLAPH